MKQKGVQFILYKKKSTSLKETQILGIELNDSFKDDILFMLTRRLERSIQEDNLSDHWATSSRALATFT